MSETVNLYRIENPNIPADPDGVVSHRDLVGQWFTPNINTALNLNYLRKSTQTFGEEVQPVDGAQLVVANVPADQLEDYHVSRHPIALTMDVENDNYLIPRDGTVPTTAIELDDVLGEMKGNIRFGNLEEARKRVIAKLGKTSVSS